MQKGPKQKNGQKAPLSTGAVGNMPALLCRDLPFGIPGETSRQKGAARLISYLLVSQKDSGRPRISSSGHFDRTHHQYLGDELREGAIAGKILQAGNG